MDRATLRERNHQRTRQEVHDAAIGLFLRQGYAETTVDQIAEAAGVSRRTFFRYFSSKDAAVFPDPVRAAELLRRALAEGDRALTAADQLRRTLVAVQFGSVTRGRARAIARLVDRHPELGAREAQLGHLLEEVVAEHLRGRGLVERHAALLAGAVFGGLQAARRLVARSDADPKAAVEDVFALLAAAFAAAERREG